jgi:hypothetical protein
MMNGLLIVLFVVSVKCMFDEKEPKYLESKVGGWVVFDCECLNSLTFDLLKAVFNSKVH